MKKQFWSLFFIFSLLLTACGKQVPVETTVEQTPVSTTASTGTTPLPTEKTESEDYLSVTVSSERENTFSEDGKILFYEESPVINISCPDLSVARIISKDLLSVYDSNDINELRGSVLSLANEFYSPEQSWTPYCIELSYQPVYLNHQILSFSGMLYSYGGSTHPNHSLLSANYNRLTGEKYALKDILISETNLSFLENTVLEHLSNLGEDIILFDDYETVVHNHFTPDGDGYQHWYLQEEGLVFFFEVYEIAPYAVGDIIITIPYSDLDFLLSSEFLPDTVYSSDSEITIASTDDFDISNKERIGALMISDDGNHVVISPIDILENLRIIDSVSGNFENGKTLFLADKITNEQYISILSSFSDPLLLVYETALGKANCTISMVGGIPTISTSQG